MNITLTFNVDGTADEVFGAINSYGASIQSMRQSISEGANNVKVTAKKVKEVVYEVPAAANSVEEPKKEKAKAEEPKKEEAKKETKKKLPTAEEPKKEEPKAAGDVKLEDIQKLGASLVSSGKQDAVQSIIHDFSITSLTDLPADKYTAVYDALKAIEEG